jgi:hypothetical protein
VRRKTDLPVGCGGFVVHREKGKGARWILSGLWLGDQQFVAEAPDPQTGEVTSLFNPRVQRWSKPDGIEQ